MTYQNRKDSSVSIRLIIKTPKNTTVTNVKYEGITKDNEQKNIDDILEMIEEVICVNLLVSSEGSDK